MSQRLLYLRKGTYIQNNMLQLRMNRKHIAIAYISIDSYLTIELLIRQELQKLQLSLV